ncbi:hypothetical protein [Asanoa iriomotensis]|uniref:Uncharacterized protein n=1 Tax=Asanoa iriomotensis TaxID=234613 RepID=A0ABQ4CCL8_9ACTN|nr:hypothetical protein [Asanoa iriomotensis]GIF60514.1 hypothetical protein Air01nite_66090 [Asanoa iriomotensis]
MDDLRHDADGETRAGNSGLSRRAFFGRTFAIAGGTVAVLGLTACPGGEQDDDEDDEDDD